MADLYPTVQVAAIQAVAPFNDRDAATEKACKLIVEAGRNGAQMVVFPEGFIPSHPNWFHHHLATSVAASRFSTQLFRNAVEVPGPVTERLGEAARDAGTIVVMGVCERLPGTTGTLFNSQVYIAPDGTILGKHQKLMPSSAERLVHMGGFGDTLAAFDTNFGPMSGLICGENNNPLAVFALAAAHPLVHAMSWPPYVSPTAEPLRNIVELASRNFAMVAGSFVISACGALDEATLDSMAVGADHRGWLASAGISGGSMVVAPGGKVIAGPLGKNEDILYAECDLNLCITRKVARDFVGHYNRADIFKLSINRDRPSLLGFEPAAFDSNIPR